MDNNKTALLFALFVVVFALIIVTQKTVNTSPKYVLVTYTAVFHDFDEDTRWTVTDNVVLKADLTLRQTRERIEMNRKHLIYITIISYTPFYGKLY
jgi:hypothetical protein